MVILIKRQKDLLAYLEQLTCDDVNVRPLTFTIKSLSVGQIDHKYLRWQVVGAPRIFDHTLEETINIQMRSVTALARIRAVVLYFMDLSGHCGYSIKAQVQLFNSIAFEHGHAVADSHTIQASITGVNTKNKNVDALSIMTDD
ncbi:Nucleolar GTP-binding protein 1 [Tilletia horrida]|nr:Nucleolar GTP-binding protein 1 [Tilletia horrida]